jgi:hypothetical protein
VHGHPLEQDMPKHVETFSELPKSRERRLRRGASVGSIRELKGPERFFYDKTSYTGVHKNGGPTSIDCKDSWSMSMRRGMH